MTERGPVWFEAQDLTREHTRGSESIRAVDGATFRILRGEHVVLFGPSGSGKTTLLQLLAGLDRPTRGTLRFQGEDLFAWPPDRLAGWRAREVGFVFQDFGLIRSLSALDNVALPAVLHGEAPDSQAAAAGLARLGMSERLHHFPHQLSRGEMQRVAIARALVHRPSLLLADEPTASLDAAASDEVMRIFEHLRAESDLTIVVATHDASWLDRADRRLMMQKGRSFCIESSQVGSATAATGSGVKEPSR